MIELALGHFPFADSDSDSDDSDFSDLEATLSPGRPNPFTSISNPSGNNNNNNNNTNGTPDTATTTTTTKASLESQRKERKERKEKKDKRKSKGVSLQGGGMTMSILELLQHIVNESAPRLNNGPGGEGKFPRMADHFIECCLLKDPDQRWTPKDLLVS